MSKVAVFLIPASRFAHAPIFNRRYSAHLHTLHRLPLPFLLWRYLSFFPLSSAVVEHVRVIPPCPTQHLGLNIWAHVRASLRGVPVSTQLYLPASRYLHPVTLFQPPELLPLGNLVENEIMQWPRGSYSYVT